MTIREALNIAEVIRGEKRQAMQLSDCTGLDSRREAIICLADFIEAIPVKKVFDFDAPMK